MSKYTAILIDDEKKSIETLKNKLKRINANIQILASTDKPKEGLVMVRELEPDMVFLDIAMPKMNGFEFLKEIEDPKFEVIFVTAFGEHAIEAIKHCAIGYLVKPVDVDELKLTIANAIKNIEAKTSLVKNKQLIENNKLKSIVGKKILIPNEEGYEFIEISSILRCEGDSGYTRLHFRNGKSLMNSLSLGYFEDVLKGSNFERTHRSHIVNMFYLKKYDKEGFVLLEDDSKVPVARSRKKSFVLNLKG